MMKRFMNSKITLLISMVVFGTLGLFVRNISVFSGELALLIMVYLFVTQQKIPFHEIKKEIPLLLFSGIAMGFNWILLFETYKYTSVSVTTLSYYFALVIVIIVCPILFKESMSIK